jgi:lipopolysaccharide transport system permease protein
MSELILEAGRTNRHYWTDLWRYRELFAILAWRDIAVRYKQTVIGAAWVVLQPVIMVVIMTLLFGKLAGLRSDSPAPYAVMVFAGMLPWQLFTNVISLSGNSIVGNAHLLTKVYFPRLIMPASAVVVALVDFAVTMAVFAATMLVFNVWPTWRLVALPAFVLLAILAALGPSLILTSLNVRYRDVRFITPVLVQIGLFASPVAYESALVRERFGDAAFMAYSLNPMVGVIDGFRWALLGQHMDPASFAIATASALALFAIGLASFRRMERAFADIV